MDWQPLAWIDEELRQLSESGLRRQLRCRTGHQGRIVTIDGRPLINFGSNDYLGLAADPRVARAAAAVLDEHGWGAGASPLVSGRSTVHAQLEKTLAEFEQTEAALVFPTGFAANCGTIAALVGPGDAVYTDTKNHASIFDGCRLSRADVRAFPHGNCSKLERLLSRSAKYRRRLIVTDGLFSMDGDLAPLPELVRLAAKYDCMLLVDEAHATGVFGPNGRGTCEHFGLEHLPIVRVGTLSKAIASQGGFVAGPQELIDLLVNKARSYIFSTASPAATAAAAIAAVQIIREEPQRRKRLLTTANKLRQTLADQGWNTGASTSQIIPLIVGKAELAVWLSDKLRQAGFFVPAIRPPSVPKGEACLRISLTCAHTEEDIERLCLALEQLRPQIENRR